ncbi:MAG TPA: 4-hydroxy-tetrahydrodipicolinate synthase [Gemmatimonadales bacterium]|jgi:4-hydroxy-tetrahydrodipicolinate synthase|nr:4-hydroxy-tetrahydrodipicolinate synthase [Gemmatimonadales bacterium]
MRFPTGCGTAIVTPFTVDGRVDEPTLRALIEWQIEEGIDFLVPCGSTGEAQTLTAQERQRVVAATVQMAAGRVPVIAGASSNDTAAAVEETRAMCALGVDGILSACPYYNKPTQAGLEQHFRAVADASSRPVVLYNVPSRTGVNLAPATTLRLARHPRIGAIKEASGDLPQMMAILRERPEEFAVLSGDDALTLPLVVLGGDGVISVVSNQVPAMMTVMTRLAMTGDFPAARHLHFELLPLIAANFLETNPGPVKAGLALMGKIENVLRLPLVPVGEATRAALAEALRSVEVAVPA